MSNPETISRFKKERFLLQMSEAQFRDEVIRPLFFRQGLKDGRDVCGPTEKGKDAVFVFVDGLGISDIYVVQTKKGNINLTRKTHENLLEAMTQLRTASETKVPFPATRKKLLPTKVILCASGKINDSAREHIVSEVSDPRLVFLDSDDLIPRIDGIFPELWLGIDAEIAPYFRMIRKLVEESDDILAISELLPVDSKLRVATDQGFVMLYLYRTVLRPEKKRGQVLRVPRFEQMPVTGILNKKKRRYLILGEAGAGKSTSILRLAYVLAKVGLGVDSKEKLRIPILLRAVHIWDAGILSLGAICDAETKKITKSTRPSFSTEDLQAGRLVILIDALDELADDDARIRVLEVVEEFHTNYPDCLVVITSRDYSFVNNLDALGKYETYRLSPINYKQAEQIVHALQKGRNVPIEQSQEVLRRIEQVHGIELNPLLVTVFAATSDYSRKDIPANITELFKKFTEMMLGRWDATKGLRQQYQAPLKDFILQKIAFEMHRSESTSIDIHRFDLILETELSNRGYTADIPQLRDEIINRSGLFVHAEKKISFRHLLIQEFFAGRGIPSADYLPAVIGNDWWRRAIVFYFGDHAADLHRLATLMRAIQTQSTKELYEAALTIGLSLQACYLGEIKEKVDIYRWVIDCFAAARFDFLNKANPDGKLPLTSFLYYYLFGRDSTALSVLSKRVDEIRDKWEHSELTSEEKDIRTFWVIVGLVESGEIVEAEKLIRQFRPIDDRLLLGIYLGCFLAQHLRVTTKQQNHSAKRICDNLSERINHMRVQILDELRSELLEVRNGAIKAIDSETGTES